jgi:hypothetical protein
VLYSGGGRDLERSAHAGVRETTSRQATRRSGRFGDVAPLRRVILTPRSVAKERKDLRLPFSAPAQPPATRPIQACKRIGLEVTGEKGIRQHKPTFRYQRCFATVARSGRPGSIPSQARLSRKMIFPRSDPM